MREQLNTFSENLKRVLAKYKNTTVEEIDNTILKTPQKSVDDWHSMGMEKFYRETDVYLYGLVQYSNWDRLENILFPITKWKKNRILDFGGGIGAISIPLAEQNTVYYYDVPSKTQDFAKYAANEFKVDINFLEQEEDVWKHEYDCVVCVDVLEHLKKPMDTVKKITKHLKKGQLFLTSGLDFSVGHMSPMHLPENVFYRPEFSKYMDEYYRLMYYIQGKRETIYMFVKK